MSAFGVFLVLGSLWFTAGAAFAAIEANRLNREVAVNDRRAWLSIEDVKLEHPTRFTEDGIVFVLSATAKNVGRTPAKNVDISFESYFPEGNTERFPDAERGFIDRLRKQPVELGSILFPDDTFVLRQTWGDGLDRMKNAITARPSGERKLGFTIFVGVSYRIMGDDSVHITYHPHSLLNVPVGAAIAEDKPLDLPPMPYLAGEAD